MKLKEIDRLQGDGVKRKAVDINFKTRVVGQAGRL